MGFLITLLSFILIRQKFNHHVTGWKSIIQQIVVFIVVEAIITTVIIAIFLNVQHFDFTDRRISIILSNLPFIVAFPIGQMLLYLLCQNLFKTQSLKFKIRAIFGPLNLVMQLTMTFYFAYSLSLINSISPTAAPFFCAIYPEFIGIQKRILFWFVSPFEMDEVYEFGSLAFAAMPYRFIYLSLDQWSQASVVFAIKYAYKLIVYFLNLKFKS